MAPIAIAHGHLGLALAFDGQSDKAIVHLEQAVRMSPHDPQQFLFNVSLAIATPPANAQKSDTAYMMPKRFLYSSISGSLSASRYAGGIPYLLGSPDFRRQHIGEVFVRAHHADASKIECLSR